MARKRIAIPKKKHSGQKGKLADQVFLKKIQHLIRQTDQSDRAIARSLNQEFKDQGKNLSISSTTVGKVRRDMKVSVFKLPTGPMSRLPAATLKRIDQLFAKNLKPEEIVAKMVGDGYKISISSVRRRVSQKKFDLAKISFAEAMETGNLNALIQHFKATPRSKRISLMINLKDARASLLNVLSKSGPEESKNKLRAKLKETDLLLEALGRV